MKLSWLTISAAAFSLAASSVCAHGLDVRADWASGIGTADKTGAVYLTIANDAYHPEYLYSATTPVAERVELHRTGPSGRMTRLDRLEIPFSDSVDMRKAGYHLMLIGLKRRLRPGERIPLELRFSDDQVEKTLVEIPGTN